MSIIGLEVFYDLIKSELTTPEDAVVALIHWMLISNDYICIGVGETPPKTANNKSEKLPTGWNSQGGAYCILYERRKTRDGPSYLLKIIQMEDYLLVNLVRLSDNQVADLSVHVRTYCSGQLTTYSSAYKNVEDLQSKLRSEVLDQLHLPSADQPTSFAFRPAERREPDGGEDPLRDSRVPPSAGAASSRADPFAVGGSDLDPFGGGYGGGMLMDPMRASGQSRRDVIPGPHRGIPRGSVPPGARFDPFGPPGTRPAPDPDHMRPPGFDDDMFM